MPDSTRIRKPAGFPGLTTVRHSIVVCAGCLVSLLGAAGVKVWTDDETRRDFAQAAQNRVREIDLEINRSFETLYVLRAYFEAPRNEGPAGYIRFANRAIADPNILAFEWAPRVTAPGRAAFEQELRSRYPNFRTMFAGAPNGPVRIVPERGEYYPISYVYPASSAPFAGYELLSSPATAPAAKRAIATGEPSSTGKLKLWEQRGSGFGITTFLATYDSPGAGRTSQWRAEHCRGLVLTVTLPEAVIDAALRNFEDAGVTTYVYDASAKSEDRRFLSAHGPGRQRAFRGNESLFKKSKLQVGGRNWEVVCVQTGMETIFPWQSLLFLLCGLSSTCGIALYLRTISRYTHELAEANVDLTREVEDRKKAQDDLQYHAYHDALTNLPNRRHFSLRLDQAIAAARQSGETIALLFVDLDGFKIVNDSLGHAVGDAVLKGVAERFAKCVGRNDVVARTGGDEFNLLLASPGSTKVADRVAQGLLETLTRPFEIEGRSLSLSASIGISIFPTHGHDSEELEHCADTAMYFAKRRGKNRAYLYSPELDSNTRRGMELALSMGRAIERNELCMFFQPIIGLGAEPSLRFEALLRWRHPELGLLEPGQFFSGAESAGLAAPIGRWVLREACLAATQWQRHSKREIGVSVNVSGLQFARADFMEAVEIALVDSGLMPELLELEITESTMVSEIQEARPRLSALRRRGISIAIDDFGTGTSSLSYLEALEIDTLKIGRCFIPKTEAIRRDRNYVSSTGQFKKDNQFRRWSLLRSLVALGRSMNLKVVLEGIETAEQFHRVMNEMGPAEVQGFHFSKPLSSSAALEFIESWNNRQGSPAIEMLFEAARPAADLYVLKPRSKAV